MYAKKSPAAWWGAGLECSGRAVTPVGAADQRTNSAVSLIVVPQRQTALQALGGTSIQVVCGVEVGVLTAGWIAGPQV